LDQPGEWRHVQAWRRDGGRVGVCDYEPAGAPTYQVRISGKLGDCRRTVS
jgi:hypothetical protein